MPTYEGTSDTCMRVNFSELGPFSTSNEETVRSTFRTNWTSTYIFKREIPPHRRAPPSSERRRKRGPAGWSDEMAPLVDVLPPVKLRSLTCSSAYLPAHGLPHLFRVSANN